MKKFIVWLLLALVVLTPVLGMSACNRPEQTVDPDQPSEQDDPKNPDGKDDPSDAATVPSEREVTVVKGSAIHEHTAELGRIPEGLAEAVNKYMTSYAAMKLQGPKTTFQTHNYTELQHLPSDAVMS